MYVIYLITLDKDAYGFNDTHYYVGQHRTDNVNDKYMGSGHVLLRVYKKYGKDKAVKTILAIAGSIEVANILEQYYIRFYRDLYGNRMLFNIRDGGRGDFSFSMPEEAHRRNIESLKRFWATSKDSESVKLRNKRISEHMKGNTNGKGHIGIHNHSEATRKKISEKVRSNTTRIPKLRAISSKRIYVLKDGKYLTCDNVKYSWKDLGFTSESALSRYVRYCDKFLKSNDFSKFKLRFYGIFVSHYEFDINIISKIVSPTKAE